MRRRRAQIAGSRPGLVSVGILADGRKTTVGSGGGRADEVFAVFTETASRAGARVGAAPAAEKPED